MSLYQPAHFWSRADHDAVVAFVQRLRPQRVLEFGPGASTLSLIEGGAWRVDALEDDEHWRKVWTHRLQRRQVQIHAYTWSDPLSTPMDGEKFDLALIDGPHLTEKRPAVIRYCLQRCAKVLVPLESIGTDLLERFVLNELKCVVELQQTGPLAGSFALLTP